MSDTAGDINLLPKVLDAASRFDEGIRDMLGIEGVESAGGVEAGESIAQRRLGEYLSKLNSVPLFV